MDTKINKSLISSWATSIYDNCEEAITCLVETKNLINSIPNSYKCDSSEGFITSMNSDIDNCIKCHTDMESLKGFLEQVIANAENA